MLESVRSRQTWGFLILTVLPASAGIGYCLRSRQDQHLLESVTPETAPTVESTRIVREKIEMLRKREARLELEEKELQTKLDRFRAEQQREGK
ncbi:uncharacterized protein JCM6883_000054 [Sporobolomyces salmoneus]|uniref:uncharacterized protein n=1 Tax=Sporobolomyces salmoneus TaxID=183962 RepID=UPI00316EBB11